MPADLKGVGKGHRLDDLHPGARRELLLGRADSRRHVGGASKRRLSRGSPVVAGVSPYKLCLWAVKWESAKNHQCVLTANRLFDGPVAATRRRVGQGDGNSVAAGDRAQSC